jgi:pyruvate/2-oxoglutarate dehydrogenase complex dihydrolipoamide acyltransferase (E2) component
MADLIPVVMPKWGLAMDEGTVAGWHFTEGDAVQAGAELVDIETSKLLNTLEAKQPGVLLRIVCEEGVVAPCGALIAVLGAAARRRRRLKHLSRVSRSRGKRRMPTLLPPPRPFAMRPSTAFRCAMPR